MHRAEHNDPSKDGLRGEAQHNVGLLAEGIHLPFTDFFVLQEHVDGEGVEEDIELKEFSDEIEGWVIEEFKKVGLDTAKSILELEKADLIKRTDLEEETIDDVLRILKEEFEE